MTVLKLIDFKKMLRIIQNTCMINEFLIDTSMSSVFGCNWLEFDACSIFTVLLHREKQETYKSQTSILGH